MGKCIVDISGTRRSRKTNIINLIKEALLEKGHDINVMDLSGIKFLNSPDIIEVKFIDRPRVHTSLINSFVKYGTSQS